MIYVRAGRVRFSQCETVGAFSGQTGKELGLGFCATLALQGLAQAAKAALLLAGQPAFAPHLASAGGTP